MKEELIAPCGINCAVCVHYLARAYDLQKQGFQKATCEGCLPRGKGCLHMGEKCERLQKGLVRFCFQCTDFPCKHIKTLDKRYRGKYHLSMVENLTWIREKGMGSFLEKEKAKWRCPGCGGAVCCHNGLCLRCQIEVLRGNKKYRWEED
jgi:hypothetical protein